MTNQRKKLLTGLALVCVSLILSLAVLEGLLIVFGSTISVRIFKTGLDSYEMFDPENSNNWILRPGYDITLSGLLGEKQRDGKTLAVGVISQLAQDYNLGPDDGLFQVNEFGFKGPDMDKAKEPDTIRIMNIGDSCTFGLVYDWCSYSRTLERYLQNEGYRVEVLNAGVEGYSTQNVLYRLDYFMSFKPDIAIVYIGWNDIYKERFGLRRLQTARALEYMSNTLFSQNQWVVKDGKLYFTDHYWDTSTPEARCYSADYEPSFLPQVQQIVDRLLENGITPVIVTLPGIFSVDTPPSQQALQIGHLPSNTRNAYVLAVMSRKYNDDLRELAKKKDVSLIDLERWGQSVFLPPESWFFDSVHLWSEGQVAIGDYIGQSLVSLGLVK